MTLDDATTLSAAQSDPTGLVRGLDRAIIDEVQRASVAFSDQGSGDRDPQPGRFLLTGSANLMTAPQVADSLAGQMETIRLLPLAQAEILSQKGTSFLTALFAGRAPPAGPVKLGQDLTDIVLAGGYRAQGRLLGPA